LTVLAAFGKRTDELGLADDINLFWISKYLESREAGQPIYFEYSLPSNAYVHDTELTVIHFWACVSHIHEDIFIFTLQDITSVKAVSRFFLMCYF
jgi:hypothetical protein